MENIHSLTTETVNPDTRDIDRVDTLTMLKKINNEDKKSQQQWKKNYHRLRKQ